TTHIARHVQALPHVSRAHVYRIGDGGAHLHIWFFARPEGQAQLYGSWLVVMRRAWPTRWSLHTEAAPADWRTTNRRVTLPPDRLRARQIKYAADDREVPLHRLGRRAVVSRRSLRPATCPSPPRAARRDHRWWRTAGGRGGGGPADPTRTRCRSTGRPSR